MVEEADARRRGTSGEETELINLNDCNESGDVKIDDWSSLMVWWLVSLPRASLTAALQPPCARL